MNKTWTLFGQVDTGKGVGNQEVIDMAVDMNSNIILTGINGLTIDYNTVKIDPAGFVQWGKHYNSSTGTDKAKAVVTDNLGNIYITGETGTSGFPGTFNMTTIKYNPNGDELWVREFDSSITAIGYRAVDMVIDNLANLYVLGQSSGADITTLKYNTNGEFQWSISYNGQSNSADNPIAIAVDQNANVFSTGNSLDFTTGYDIAIIKYLQTPTSVESETDVPSSYVLSQNYPNPFNPNTKISWQSSVSSQQTLKVYDIIGNEVVTLMDEYKPAGNYEVTFTAEGLASGVYVYQLKAGEFIQTKKMILLQ